MQKHDVPRSTGTTESLSFGWLDEAPEGESFVASYGRVFDVIVMHRSDAKSTGLYNRSIESGLFRVVGRYSYLHRRRHARSPPTS
jgi:hypothetical protein